MALKGNWSKWKLIFTKIDLHGIIKLYGPKISCKLLSKLHNYSCREATTGVGIKLLFFSKHILKMNKIWEAVIFHINTLEI